MNYTNLENIELNFKNIIILIKRIYYLEIQNQRFIKTQ